mmetsp:Transcript_1800/g.3201  ORF Transcript_1800/g.3201 Transcript_1800/m.3201 type:complete len:225 (-) Transcript_1800:430-1104(-)
MMIRVSRWTTRIYRSCARSPNVPAYGNYKAVYITAQRRGTALIARAARPMHTGTTAHYAHCDPSFNDNLQGEIDDANERYRGILKINGTPLGYGLEASRSFREGDKVMSSKALEVTPIGSHTVQTGWNRHVLIDLPARFVNHSCDANLGIKDNIGGAYDFFALKQIDEGSELLWDYETSEYEIGSFETCLCGSQRCRGSLGGFKKHGDQIKNLYGEHVADYLKE